MSYTDSSVRGGALCGSLILASSPIFLRMFILKIEDWYFLVLWGLGDIYLIFISKLLWWIYSFFFFLH